MFSAAIVPVTLPVQTVKHRSLATAIHADRTPYATYAIITRIAFVNRDTAAIRTALADVRQRPPPRVCLAIRIIQLSTNSPTTIRAHVPISLRSHARATCNFRLSRRRSVCVHRMSNWDRIASRCC
jgi:hypothetical protein